MGKEDMIVCIPASLEEWEQWKDKRPAECDVSRFWGGEKIEEAMYTARCRQRWGDRIREMEGGWSTSGDNPLIFNIMQRQEGIISDRAKFERFYADLNKDNSQICIDCVSLSK